MTNLNREVPTPEEVNDMHRYSDADTTTDSLHHTLGRGPTQAAKGNHVHDGVGAELTGRYDTVRENSTSLPNQPALNFRDSITTNDGGFNVLDDLGGVQTTVESKAHSNPDTDTSSTAIHHTLGAGESQAAPGNHGHPHEHVQYSETTHTHAVLHASRTFNTAVAGNTTLTLAVTPYEESLQIFVDGLLKQFGVFYTVAANVVTFAAALIAGQIVADHYLTTTDTPADSVLT